MTSNYPPPPTGAPTEPLGPPPGMGPVMSSQPPSADPLSVSRRGPLRTHESAPGWRTTEFGVFVVVALGNLLASALAHGADGQRDDYFRADKAWFFITLLTIGYMISRGLAKIGKGERRDG
jgi:hypothetical protein